MAYFKKPILVSIAIGCVVIECIAGFVAYQSAIQSEQRSLVERTKSVAAALDVDKILALTGTKADVATANYQSLKQTLMRIGEANTDVTSVYITGYRDGNVFFFVDSVASGDVDEATPGLTYGEATPEFIAVLTEGRMLFEGPVTDRWGSWVSAAVPLRHPQTQAVIASVGMDVRSGVYVQRVIAITAVPVLLLGIIMLVLLVMYVHYLKSKEVLMLKARFVSIASHELRSPVAGIVWAAQSLLKTESDGLKQSWQNTIRLIEQTGHQILKTVSEILDLSRLQDAQANKVVLEAVDISELIRETAQGLTLVMKQSGVVVRIDASLPHQLMVMCDRQKTQRVIANVLTNALKYSPGGGEVVIAYQADATKHVISITDQGVGIPEADQANVFKNNFRASNVERSLIAGSGIGLHLVKGLMEMQGGSIRFISKSGSGTTFFIEFPKKQ